MNRLLLDQGLPRSAAAALRSLGWDVQHVGERGMAAATDEDILAIARKEGRVVVTLDADFHALLAVAGDSSPSVVRVRIEGLKGTELVRLLEKVWAGAGEFLSQGAMVTVTQRALRIKLLRVERSASRA